jgi:hypothetical protein
MLPFGGENLFYSSFGLVGPETITIYNTYISEYRPDKLLSFGWMQFTYDRLRPEPLQAVFCRRKISAFRRKKAPNSTESATVLPGQLFRRGEGNAEPVPKEITQNISFL